MFVKLKENDNIMILKDKKDQILSGIVKRLEFGNIIVDLGKTEGIYQKR